MADLQKQLEQAGASPSLAKFLSDTFAVKHHVHSPTEVMVDDEQNLDSWGDSVEERLEGLAVEHFEVEEEDEDDEEDEEQR